ncbi:hypothetical protein ACA910_015073 [Epithemia clementina (nom. ined.)]
MKIVLPIPTSTLLLWVLFVAGRPSMVISFAPSSSFSSWSSAPVSVSISIRCVHQQHHKQYAPSCRWRSRNHFPISQQQRQLNSILGRRRRPKSLDFALSATTRSTTDPNAAVEDASFLDSNDPFRVLQIQSPTADAKEIRKAYRRMAVRYHPDVTTNKDSSIAEKKLANDRFAKINWAYQTLSGKNNTNGGSTTAASASSGKGSQSSSSSSSSSGWTPPHRRRSQYASSSSSSSSSSSTSSSPFSSSGRASTDWRDYMPNYGREDTEQDYDAGGDSFGAIFADLFRAAGASAVGGGGILRDFVEFLEKEAGSSGFSSSAFGSSSSLSSSSSLDDELRILLQTGTVDQIGEEMDDAVLVQQQLETKLSNLQQDDISLTADLKLQSKLSEQMSLQEELAAVQARIPVVQNYLKQSRKRLLALQMRYKELIARGGNDSKAGGGRSSNSASESVWETLRNDAPSSSSSSYNSNPQSPRSSSATASTSSTSTTATTGVKDEDAWKHDSFGSFGRGRSRATRRPRNDSESSSTSSSSSWSQQQTPEQTRQQRTTATSSSPPPQQQQEQQQQQPQQNIPPHRRPSYTSFGDDKRRLRELKVDEEFDKLKKELGIE